MLISLVLPLVSLILSVRAAISSYRCSPAIITAPRNGGVIRSTTLEIKAVITDPICPAFLLLFDGRFIGSLGYRYPMTTSDIYTVSIGGLAPGQHTLATQVTGTDANGDSVPFTTSDPITFTIVLPTPCTAPTITGPAAGSVLSTRDVTITGTFARTPECPTVLLYLEEEYVGQATISGTSFSLNAYAEAKLSTDNVYNIRAVVKSASADWKDSDPSASTEFSVQFPHCDTPRILTPTANSMQSGTMLSITGTFAGGSSCSNLNVYVNGVDQGFVRTSGNTFSITSYVSGSGAYTIRAISRSSESTSLDSVSTSADDRVVNVRIPCPMPTLDTPFSGSSQQSKQLVFTGSVSQSRPECWVAIYVNGILVAQTTPSASGAFAAFYVVSADGAHQFYARSKNTFGVEGDSLPSSLRTVNVIPSTPCDQPVIGAPANNLEQHSKNIAISGAASSRADCQTADIFVDNVNVGRAVISAGRFSLTHTVATEGSHRIFAVFRSSAGSALDSVPSVVRTVIVDSSRCPLPVISSPLQNTAQNGGSLTISGTAKGGSGCPLVLLTLDDITPRVAAVSNGAWTYTFPSTSDGAHTVKVVNIFPNDRSYDSDIASVAVKSYLEPCPAPILLHPKKGETSTTSIYFSGAVDGRVECGSIQIYMEGVLIYSTSTDAVVAPSRRKRALQQFSFTVPTDNLPPGNHEIYAVSTGENNGVRSDPIPIIIQNSGPSPTGSFRRKRSTCKPSQTMCAFKANGRTRFECIDHIESLLERCGACDGPDCSEIPNASDVACVHSQCIVSTCIEGFKLVNNTCVETPEGFALQW